jgi:poly(3-hydroxyalkanoate) synthetase
MPVLNVFAKDDHIIPPATSQALGAHVGTKDYSELALPGGHVGVFVGGKSQALLGSGIAKWLAEGQRMALNKIVSADGFRHCARDIDVCVGVCRHQYAG